MLAMVVEDGDITWLYGNVALVDPMTTRGDIIFRNASGNTTRLPLGPSGEFLKSDGSDIAWGVGGGGGLSWSVITSNTNAISSNGYLINASGGNITLTLPAAPSSGDTIGMCDIYNQATTNIITIARNGLNIEGAGSDLVFDVDGAGMTLVYADATRGWEIVSEISAETSEDKLPLSGGIMSGDITLGENAEIKLDPSGSADGKFTGITVSGVAGIGLSFGDVCYLSGVDSKWELTDASAASTSGNVLVGVCVSAAAEDAATVMLLHGIIRADTAFPAITISAQVYVSETPGDIVVTQPVTTDAVIRVLGRGLTANEIYFNPSEDYITHT